MDIEPITTPADYRAVLEEINSLMAAKKGTPERQRLDALANLIVAYEITEVTTLGRPHLSLRSLTELPKPDEDFRQERQSVIAPLDKEFLPAQFVTDTLRAKAEAEAGKLKPYQFNGEDRVCVGELPEYDALWYLDSPESITAYLADIIEANDADLLEAALSTISPLIPRATVAPIPLDLASEAGRERVLEAAKRVIATHADALAALARR